MDRVIRENIKERCYQGKKVKEAFGADAYIKENETSMGFMTVRPDAAGRVYTGAMMESYLVENVSGAYVVYDGKKELLEKQDVLVVGKGDTYCFEFDSDDSFVDFVYFIPNGEALA